jgi:hypothetical protein
MTTTWSANFRREPNCLCAPISVHRQPLAIADLQEKIKKLHVVQFAFGAMNLDCIYNALHASLESGFVSHQREFS